MNDNLNLRLARCEAICNLLRTEMEDVLWDTYTVAVANQDAELAAVTARKIRNKKLIDTDNRCTLDRVLPAAPQSDSFEDWLPWLQTIAAHKADPWGVYRQLLRDIPEQEGFPFTINWGEEPID